MRRLFLFILQILTLSLAQQSRVLQEFIVGNYQFSANVYTEVLTHASGNFLICPLSVEIVLGLMKTGAKGRTAQQISKGLHLIDDPENLLQAFSELLPILQLNENYTLSSANKMYIKNGLEINPEFKNTAANIFDTDIQNISFERKQHASSKINKWVKEKTQGKVKNLIKPAALSKNTTSILINAMYFKGTWLKSFDQVATRKGPFYLNNKHYVNVAMMEITDHFFYFENSELNAKFLEMFYEGYDITMTFVLPNDKEGLALLESRIEDVLSLTRHPYEWEVIEVQVPRFKIETTIKFKLILQALGIREPFQDNADFSGITLNAEYLKINELVQKTFIEIDEKGTTAATALAESIDEVITGSVPRKQFIADHPFMYYLSSSAGIMFVGRYVQQS